MPVDYEDNTNEGPKISEDADPNTTSPFSILKNVGADYLTNKTDKDTYVGFCLLVEETPNAADGSTGNYIIGDKISHIIYARIEEIHAHLPNPFDKENLSNGNLNYGLVYNHTRIEFEESTLATIGSKLGVDALLLLPAPEQGQFMEIKFKDKQNLEHAEVVKILTRPHVPTKHITNGSGDSNSSDVNPQRNGSSSGNGSSDNRKDSFGAPLATGDAAKAQADASENWNRIRKYKDTFFNEGRRIRVDPYILMGIASNESGGKTFISDRLTGDGGQAYGMMQVNEVADKGKWSGLVAKWKSLGATPEGNIAMGATVLRKSIDEAYKNFGESFLPRDVERIGIANYNTSIEKIKVQVEKNQDPDNATTKGMYSRKVMIKAKKFRELDNDNQK